MLLKRLYEHTRDGPRPVGVKVLHAGPRQRFSTQLVERAVYERWMTMGEGKIVIHAVPEPLAYRIVAMPGYYCCYCGKQQPAAQEAKAHVAVHAEATIGPSWIRRKLLGAKSAVPDPENPSGYRLDNFYECILERR